VSNFALPGRSCRHNAAVWRGEAYLGLGPAAVGTVAGERRRNAPDLAAYLEALAPGPSRPPSPPPREVERLGPGAAARERLFLAARTGARCRSRPSPARWIGPHCHRSWLLVSWPKPVVHFG